MGLSFDATGDLYFTTTSGRRFSTMDITSGDLSNIATGGSAPNTSALAINESGIFGVNAAGIDNELLMINPIDGSSVIVGSGIGITIGSLVGLEFDEAGVLWGVDKQEASLQETLFTIDTTTGTATLASPILLEGTGELVNEIESLAVIPAAAQPTSVSVPLPLWSLLCGVVLIMFVYRKQITRKL